MKIRIYSLLLFMALGVLTSCSNDDDNSEIEFESTAEIKGLDLTLCACCGGWIIEIDGDGTDRRFEELPDDSDIDLDSIENDGLPISVKLNWSESDEYCGNGITIESIELIQ